MVLMLSELIHSLSIRDIHAMVYHVISVATNTDPYHNLNGLDTWMTLTYHFCFIATTHLSYIMFSVLEECCAAADHPYNLPFLAAAVVGGYTNWGCARPVCSVGPKYRRILLVVKCPVYSYIGKLKIKFNDIDWKDYGKSCPPPLLNMSEIP